jgi:hypothetical protein
VVVAEVVVAEVVVEVVVEDKEEVGLEGEDKVEADNISGTSSFGASEDITW